MRWFNELVLLRYGRGVKRALMHPQTFFYPLDALLDWNKAYGKRGLHASTSACCRIDRACPSTARCSRRSPRAAAHPTWW